MASSPSAKKRIRQNLKARARNRWRKRTLKDVLKDLDEKLVHGAPAAEIQTAFRSACRVLDRTAQKGVIHANTAARKKSRLSARVKSHQSTGGASSHAPKAKTAKVGAKPTSKASAPAKAAPKAAAAKPAKR